MEGDILMSLSVEEGDTRTTLPDNGGMWVCSPSPKAGHLDSMTRRGQENERQQIELARANGSKFPALPDTKPSAPI